MPARSSAVADATAGRLCAEIQRRAKSCLEKEVLETPFTPDSKARRCPGAHPTHLCALQMDVGPLAPKCKELVLTASMRGTPQSHLFQEDDNSCYCEYELFACAA